MGNLYIVSTPIGNLQDITFRASMTLLESSLIVAESASKADLLLKFLIKKFGITRSKPRIISLTQNEEEYKIPMIISSLESQNVALISEAGTPLISDPGFKLVREAIKRNVQVVPIPGPSSPIAALSASGLPSDNFLFAGFLPKKIAKKEKILGALKKTGMNTTIIVFESQARLLGTLSIIKEVFGNVDVAIARELTKVHEEFIRGKAEHVLNLLKNRNIKGEITILFSSQP